MALIGGGMRLVFAFALSVISSAAWAGADIDQCDFNKIDGNCTSPISVDEATGSYTIPATGSCQTVTVLIDGTQYPHRMKDQAVTDSVMVFDKTKNATVSVATCTRSPTKAEVIGKCQVESDHTVVSCMAPVRPNFEACKADKKTQAEVQPCLDDVKAMFVKCYDEAVEVGNKCAGGDAFFVERIGTQWTNRARKTY